MVPKKYVITGGPCSGKTSLINYLKQKKHHIVTESATDIIFQYEKQKKNPLDYIDEFEADLFEIQLKKENEIDASVSIIFLDRSLIDSIAYKRMDNRPISQNLFDACKTSGYSGVFFCELVDNFNTKYRLENNISEARKIETSLKNTYGDFGFCESNSNLWNLSKKLSIEERAKQVLEII